MRVRLPSWGTTREKVIAVGAQLLTDGEPIESFLGNETMAHRNDQDRIEKTHNLPGSSSRTPGFLVLLVGSSFGLVRLPFHAQRKDPDISGESGCGFLFVAPARTAQQVEQFVTRRLKDAVR